MSVTATAFRTGPLDFNGVTTSFPLTFHAMSEEEVRVFRFADGVETDITSGFTITGLPGVGTVVFDTAPVDGWGAFYAEQAPAYTQDTVYEAQAAFNATAAQQALDRLAVADRHLAGLAGRALRVQTTELDIDPLPLAADRADNLLEFDADGAVRADRNLDDTIALQLSRVVAQVTLTEADMASASALRAAIAAIPGLYPIIPRGTWPINMLASPGEIDISLLGGLQFAPGAKIVSDNPARGLFRALETDKLLVEGMEFGWEFLAGIRRPDIAWTHTLNAAGNTVTAINEDMIDWLEDWNAAYGVSLSTSTTSVLTLKQRWDLVYTGTPFAALGQISAGGRPSGLLLDGCSRTRINGLRGNNCVALINDQGGTRTGEDVYGFGTHVDSIEMPDDARFGYLGKGVAITIDEVRGNTNGTRDTGGAPHGVYVAGSPDAGNVNTALQIKSVQAREWGIGPFIKAREASLALGPMVAERVQSLLGLVHCTGYVGPITSLDQILNRDENGDEITSSGSKYTANFTRCYDMQVARMGVQHRASTALVSQDTLRVADINGCSGMTFDGFDVNCHRLSDGPAMVRLSLTTDSSMGRSSLVNTGTNDVYLYEGGLSGEIGGSNGGSNGGLSFDVVRCSAKAKIADLGGATRNSRFTVDTRLLTDGFEDNDTIRDDSFGASNNINFTVGERIVPLSAAPSFVTRAYDSLLLSYTEDEESDDDTVLNYANGETVTIDGRTYTAVNTLTANDQFKIGSEGSDSQKNLKALVNLADGSGTQAGYKATTAHATFFSAASGREFVAINRVTGAVGNGKVMSTTSTRAAWANGASANGGLADLKLLNSLLDMTAGSSGITVPLPDHALVPVGSRIAVRKADSAAGYVYVRDVDGTTLHTLKVQGRMVRLVSDAAGWAVESAGDDLAADPADVRDTSLASRSLADENLYFLVGNIGSANQGALRVERMPFSALKVSGSNLDIQADAETWQIVDPAKTVRDGFYNWNLSGGNKIYDASNVAFGEIYEFCTSSTSNSTIFLGTEAYVYGLSTAGQTIEVPASTRIALRRQSSGIFQLIDYTPTTDGAFRYASISLSVGLNDTPSANLFAINRLDSSAGAGCRIRTPSPSGLSDGTWVIYEKSSTDTNYIQVEIFGSSTDVAWLTYQQDRVTLRVRSGAWEVDSWAIAPRFDLYTSTGANTWTRPPLASNIHGQLIPGGAGGGSGRCGNAGAVRTGGNGGNGASLVEFTRKASDLDSSVTVTVGAGGAGGASTSTDGTSNAGTAGGATTFGSSSAIYYAYTVAPTGGLGGGTGTNTQTTSSPIGYTAATGASASATGAAGSNGGTAWGMGGASGGGITSGNAYSAGGTGRTSINGLSNTGGSAGSAGVAGTAGTSAAGPTAQVGGFHPAPSGGGGGSGEGGGAGGNGGGYGGAGGGGGASLTGTASGKGGDGANGAALIITYFGG
jgi:hypothetical protein